MIHDPGSTAAVRQLVSALLATVLLAACCATAEAQNNSMLGRSWQLQRRVPTTQPASGPPLAIGIGARPAERITTTRRRIRRRTWSC